MVLKRADAIVIGAGVIGASAAFHLARAGLSVIVIDRAPGPGGGSTARATGGFRAQFGTAINVRLSLLSRDKLRSFRDETGVDPGFSEVGYLWLASSESDLEELRSANALQRREGLGEARIVDVAGIAELNPHVSRAGIVGGAWGPSDGVFRPSEISRGYCEAAARDGVVFRWNESPRAIEREADRITAVVTEKERYATNIVVNAAGAWAADVARRAGVEIPITPLRRQVAITKTTSVLPPDFPMTIWTADGFHLRVRGDHVLLLRPSPGASDPFAIDVEPSFLDAIDTLKKERVPALANVDLDRQAAWAGLYEMSPDKHVLLGPAPGCPNLLLANGSSGHGVMHAPALGQLISEIATKQRATTLDAHVLRPSRFLESDPVLGPTLL